PFLDRFAVHVSEPLDTRAKRAAANAFVGEHDFSSFCRKAEASLVRRIRTIAISTPSPERLVLRVVADSFCHQMVRSLVGLLLDIGRGKRPVSAGAKALKAGNRAAAGSIAPAKGLTLISVGYSRDPFRGGQPS
ncbi:MAG: tRNA pseudouridine synthase A, partial [Actinomycetota bacterium]